MVVASRCTAMFVELDDDCWDDNNPLSMLDPAGVTPRRARSDESDEAAHRDAKCGRVADGAVTQADAKAWFDDPAADVLGRGAHGIVKARILDEGSPSTIGRAIAIKRWFVEGDEKQPQFQAIYEIRQGVFRPRPEVLRDAQHEVAQHLQAWDLLKNDRLCRKWIAQPARMDWDQVDSDGAVYAVQELVYDKERAGGDPAKWSDFRARTLMSVTETNAVAADQHQLWKKLPDDDGPKERFCEAYGEMLACLAQAKLLHNDFHNENVMVFSNYSEDTMKTLKEGQAYIQWAGIVDWGMATQVSGNGPRRTKDQLCVPRSFEVGYQSGDGDTCVAESTEDVEFANDFAQLLWGNASCQGKDPKQCGTDGRVKRLIHKGFAWALGLKMPEPIKEEVKKEHLDEYRRRGGTQAAGFASAAAVRVAIRGTGMPDLSNLRI